MLKRKKKSPACVKHTVQWRCFHRKQKITPISERYASSTESEVQCRLHSFFDSIPNKKIVEQRFMGSFKINEKTRRWWCVNKKIMIVKFFIWIQKPSQHRRYNRVEETRVTLVRLKLQAYFDLCVGEEEWPCEELAVPNIRASQHKNLWRLFNEIAKQHYALTIKSASLNILASRQSFVNN